VSSKLEEQIKKLKQAITEMEEQRQILGDAAVDASLAPFQEKLAELEAKVEPQKELPRKDPVRLGKQVTLLYVYLVDPKALTLGLDLNS